MVEIRKNLGTPLPLAGALRASFPRAGGIAQGLAQRRDREDGHNV
jgi:hypothetical protein